MSPKQQTSKISDLTLNIKSGNTVSYVKAVACEQHVTQ